MGKYEIYVILVNLMLTLCLSMNVFLYSFYWATVCKTVHPMLSVRCLFVLSCLSVMLVYCGQMVVLIKTKLGMEVGLGPGYIVLDGDTVAPSQRAQPPQFSAHVCYGQTAGWIKMPLGTKVGVGPGDIVLDGVPAPPSEKGGTTSAIFGP